MGKEQRLPYTILKTASGLFAGGGTGFSYTQMEQFFCYELHKHPNEVVLPPANNRSEMFENWLSLFPLSKQKSLLLRLCSCDLPMWHGKPDASLLEKLARQIESASIDETVSPKLREVNSEVIAEHWRKALDRRQEDTEGAITAARTLIETICKHILDESGEIYDPKMDLPKLYSLAAKQLTLSPSQHTEEIFKRILMGCQDIVIGLGSVRNHIGDAHGKSQRRVKPSARHAEFAVNLAGTVATFLLATWEARNGKTL